MPSSSDSFVSASGSSEQPEIITIRTNNVPFDFEEINKILEEKDYPYRLEHVVVRDTEDIFNQSRDEIYEEDKELMKEYDIFVYDFFPSYFESLCLDGNASELDDRLLSLLPEDMYLKFDGKSYIFPSNFSYTSYFSLNPDLYYAVVKDELIEEYKIGTLEELEAYMLEHDDYTVANSTQQYFGLDGCDDFEGTSWYLGIHWDDENEIFYNPYTEETEHLELSMHLFSDIQETSENDADIIFHSAEKEGYTGIGYQSDIMNTFCNLGIMFGINSSSFAQQFVYDLYTDPDLSNAAPLDFTDEGIYFGNLELMKQEILQEYYGFNEFSYENFVLELQSTKSKLFDKGITILDACTIDQYLEMMEHGKTMSLGSAIGDPGYIDQIISSQSDDLDEIIERLNQLYQLNKE